jgi:hypothetical protein
MPFYSPHRTLGDQEQEDERIGGITSYLKATPEGSVAVLWIMPEFCRASFSRRTDKKNHSIFYQESGVVKK